MSFTYKQWLFAFRGLPYSRSTAPSKTKSPTRCDLMPPLSISSIVCLRSSGNCLRLLPRLPATSILPSVFSYIKRFNALVFVIRSGLWNVLQMKFGLYILWMAQAVTRQHLTAQIWLRFRSSPCEIRGDQNNIQKGSSSTSVSPLNIIPSVLYANFPSVCPYQKYYGPKPANLLIE